MLDKQKHRKNYNIAGCAHELTFSCYKKFQFLKAERTCQWLAEAIEGARDEWRFQLWAFVFMHDHVHLIICPRQSDYDISQIRNMIKSPVGKKAIRFLARNAPHWLPKITRVRGKKTERLFWQSGGGYDRNIEEPRTLHKMMDYIHMNPVRRRFVDKAANWKWSSAAWYLDAGPVPIELDPIPPEWTVGIVK